MTTFPHFPWAIHAALPVQYAGMCLLVSTVLAPFAVSHDQLDHFGRPEGEGGERGAHAEVQQRERLGLEDALEWRYVGEEQLQGECSQCCQYEFPVCVQVRAEHGLTEAAGVERLEEFSEHDDGECHSAGARRAG